MIQARIFVSHCSADRIVAAKFVRALRNANTDVWYDEHNLGTGQIWEEISRELKARPIFLVLLSKNAFASKWVRDECNWAYTLYAREPTRILLPVTIQPIERAEFDNLLFIEGFKRIEAPGYLPLPFDDAVRRTLKAIGLAPDADMRSSLYARTPESLIELLAFGKILGARRQYHDAALCFERITELSPDHVDAWANLGYVYDKMERWHDAAIAYRRALKLDGRQIWMWFNLSSVERNQGNYAEALVALNQVTDLNPKDSDAWIHKGDVLTLMKRERDASSAYARARVLDPTRLS